MKLEFRGKDDGTRTRQEEQAEPLDALDYTRGCVSVAASPPSVRKARGFLALRLFF